MHKYKVGDTFKSKKHLWFKISNLVLGIEDRGYPLYMVTILKSVPGGWKKGLEYRTDESWIETHYKNDLVKPVRNNIPWL